jgi:glucose-1-phosphatase
MNKVIALDIGDVSLHRCLKPCFEFLGVANNQSLKNETLTVVDQYERGLISFREWLNCLGKITNGRFTDEEICHGWNLLIGNDMPGMAKFVAEMIESGFRFVFFSDTSELHFGDISRKLSFANLVTGAILSYEVGAKKPESAMYEAFEAKYGVPCCYLDDQPGNIAAGQKRGWFSIQFTDTETMRQEFSSQFNL